MYSKPYYITTYKIAEPEKHNFWVGEFICNIKQNTIDRLMINSDKKGFF